MSWFSAASLNSLGLGDLPDISSAVNTLSESVNKLSVEAGVADLGFDDFLSIPKGGEMVQTRFHFMSSNVRYTKQTASTNPQ